MIFYVCFDTVDGVFRAWTEWSGCTLTCGNGTQNRNRSCEGPFFEGKNCTGDWDQIKDCNTFPCPGKQILQIPENHELEIPHVKSNWFILNSLFVVDGFWMSWSNWSECSKSCGRGFTFRTRICEEPKYGGLDCEGPSNETMSCYPSSCPGM